MSKPVTQREMDLIAFIQLGAMLKAAEDQLGPTMAVEVKEYDFGTFSDEGETLITFKQPLVVYQRFAGKTPQEAAQAAMKWVRKVSSGEIYVEIHPVAAIPHNHTNPVRKDR